MKSLLNKAKDINAKEIKILEGETEKDITLALLELPTVLDKSMDTRSLNEIADYLYNLTSLYNKFYAEHKVLSESDKDLQESWLILTTLVYKVNSMLLDILGIKVPEKM